MKSKQNSKSSLIKLKTSIKIKKKWKMKNISSDDYYNY